MIYVLIIDENNKALHCTRVGSLEEATMQWPPPLQIVELDTPVVWPPRPDDWSSVYWRDGALIWEDPRSLEEVKLQKNQEINETRTALNQGTFTYQNKEISCDPLSRGDIDGVNGYVSLTGELPTNWTGTWKTQDNSYVTIETVDHWKAFYSAMVQKGLVNFSQSQALKTQLATATTVEEVKAITWPQ